ncbi:MAG: MerR family transcriptional regulator [Candidatus Wallbacteria bacterium]|nr:MerR family transcriptional regulator [Candidatus Wallbacteria bacterium]
MQQDKFLTINEITEILSVPASTVRFWESEFKEFLHPSRDSRNRRLYSKNDLSTLRWIRQLLDTEKYTLAGARQKLNGSASRRNEVATVLQSALFELEHGAPIRTVVDKYVARLV